MKILALDTSTKLTGIALLDTETGKSCFARQEMTTHSEAIIPLIGSCLQEQNWKQNDIEGIACGAGPGSFTGLRMGLATAKGLCFSLNIPLVLVSSLEALATQKKPTTEEKPTFACMYASQGKVYARLILPSTPLFAEEQNSFLLDSSIFKEHGLQAHIRKLLQDDLWSKEELFHIVSMFPVPFFICGDAVVSFPELLVPQAELLPDRSPHPQIVATLGANHFQKGEISSIEDSVPFYKMVPLVEQR